jgi:hypothetical protein
VVAAEAVWAPVEQAETTPVTVVEEAEPWSGARRHSTQEAHSPRAERVEEPEKSAAVEAPDGVDTPALARCSVRVVARPRVARQEALGRWWAQQRASGPRVAEAGAPGPHVAQ